MPRRVAGGALLPPSPLRTVRDSFPSYGSSLSKGHPYGVSRSPTTTSRYTVTVRIAQMHAGGTSCPCGRRHLPSLLSSDSFAFHVTRDPPNVSSPHGAGPVSTGIPTITAGHSLLSARQSSPPSACLTVSPPRGRRYWVSTFRIVDHLDNLGAPRTPVVLRFRTSTLETCILTTPLHSGERVFDLLVFVGRCSMTTLQAFTCIHHITRP